MKIFPFVNRNRLFSLIIIINLIISSYIAIKTPKPINEPEPLSFIVPGFGEINFENYPKLERTVIGLINSLRDFYDVDNFSNDSINAIDKLPNMLTQYFLSFTAYGLAQVSDTTPGFRTNYYKNTMLKLISMMNSSSMQYLEWSNTKFSSPLYEELGNEFRGPTNIMWTGHYALMELMYSSLFNDNRFDNEIKWYMDDWNTSLSSATTWDGKDAADLGLWNTGLIPCEPYIVFIQCNLIAFFAMYLYDNLHGTNYQKSTLPGMRWWQENMIDNNGIPVDGYFISEPIADDSLADRNDLPVLYPNLALTPGTDEPKVSSYSSAWIIMFLKGMGYDILAESIYEDFKGQFIHYTDDNRAYVPNTYYNPSDFGTFEIVGNLFTYFLTKEMGDSILLEKLENYFYTPFQGYWSDDGRNYQFDTSGFGELSDFLNPIVNFGQAYGRSGSSLNEILSSHTSSFWDQPYISNQSTTDGLFVYQAIYDEKIGAFILNVEIGEDTILTLDNFPDVQGIYSLDGSYNNWVQNGNKLEISFEPGLFSFVIM